MKVRNWKSKVAMSFVAAGVGAGSAQADTITTLLGLSETQANNTDIPAGHGSNAEVALVWSADGGDPRTDWDVWAWPGTTPTGAYQIDGLRPWISFTPSAGHRVGFTGFEFAAWHGIGDVPYQVRIWAGTAPGTDGSELALFTGDAIGLNTYAVATTITPVSLNFFGAVDQALTIEFRQIPNGPASYMAMDNFTFQTQAIPEPGSLAVLGLAGLGASMMRRRRNK